MGHPCWEGIGFEIFNWIGNTVSVVASLRPSTQLDTLLEKYAEVFSEELGTIKPFQVKLFLKEGAKPKFCRTRPVPYVMKVAVEQELDRLEKVGVLKKVDFSDWATPVVLVPKKEGKVRLCGDYRVMINPVGESMILTSS